tara:strand:- start:2874 stop:5006 length:2133 start_codon:yes stop_codon:yes gene_type:complete
MAEIDDLSFETDEVTAAEDGVKSIFESRPSVVAFVEERFRRSEDSRRGDEDRWLRAYRNYRGLYGPDVQFTDTEKSRIFVKVTKTKTIAAYGQIVDVLFGNNNFPLTVNPTVLPDGVSESVHINLAPNAEKAGDTLKVVTEDKPSTPYLLDGTNKLKPGETLADLKNRLGPLEEKLSSVSDKIVEGDGTGPTTVTFHPAMIAAKKMEKKIHDQLLESGASIHLRSMAFEQALLGTGVMKGPFAVDKEYPNWDDEGNYDPIVKTVPECEHVSVWNFYPDPEASSMQDAEYVVQRHKMSRTQIRQLKSRPYFMNESIQQAIAKGADYTQKHWEMAMSDDSTQPDSERWEVLEFWGFVDIEHLEENGVKIPKEYKNLDELNCNIWVCNGEVIRFVLNPFKPSNIPYYAVPFEHNPYSFFGIGIAENMDDTQTLMNGFMRMSIDNAALSGNLIIEVDESNLVPGQDLSIYPGKVFRRQGGAPGQAIFGTKFPNVAQENLQLFDKARTLADESTGFPSFAHGQTGVSGVGRTASGISMLMSAANGSIRTVVKNVDDYLLRPLGKAFFAFNMQFDYDEEIKGDLEVKAAGTESLMANEVRSQRLMQFLQVAQNPTLAPFAKMDYIIREIAKSMDLDPSKVTNSMQDAAIQAEILKGFNQPAPVPQAPEGASPPEMGGQAPQSPQGGVQDTSGGGGGQIGTGTAPLPNEQGFSGNVA